MKTIFKSSHFSLFIFFLITYNNLLHHSNAQPNTTGYTCTPNQTTTTTTTATFPCQTYVFYRAAAPKFLDLASVADLFSVSRLMISKPSNISSPAAALSSDQSLFVPITCSCNTINKTTSISFANLSFAIKAGDTYYDVSTKDFQNLTTFQSVIAVNPNLVPTNLPIGVNVDFPIFCKCPNSSSQVSYLISYVFQPSDTLSSVASRFGVSTKSITDVNGNKVDPFDTLFVPVTRLPALNQPIPVPGTDRGGHEREGVVKGLGIGLGFTGFLLVLVTAVWVYRERVLKKKMGVMREEGERRVVFKGGGKGVNEMEVNLMADVSDCLDKYRVFRYEQLREATDGFSEDWLIHGSVYKGCINGDFYAVKKMKWNASEELKILQKVNHGNLVRLEGFCIDPEDASCYLVYEYIENGSLQSWLHDKKKPEKLSWKTRLKIAIDVANGLQYVHEHTRPRVVHKDIKSSNILLDSNMRAKIANFGLAKSGCNAITMHIVGTHGYIAPEYLADGVVSTKMDVFSFGVVLLELMSSKDAIDGEGKLLWVDVGRVLDGNDESKKIRRLRDWMDRSILEETCPIESVMNVMNIAMACLHKDPSKRPSMVDIVYALCKSDDLFFDISDDGSSGPIVTGR